VDKKFFEGIAMTNLKLVPRIVFASAALLMGASAFADQKLNLAQSEIVFVSKQMGVPVEGRFKKFDAQLSFDPAKPEASKMAFTVDVGSATLGAPETDAELPKATWFNAPKFPQATFQSSAVKGLGGGKFEVTGKLSIKGNVRDVVVPVVLTQAGANTTATGTFVLKRLTFKIGENEWADTSMVADDVQVKFKLGLTGVGKL
jgi:polyisoprenoid-binding protein YceI